MDRVIFCPIHKAMPIGHNNGGIELLIFLEDDIIYNGYSNVH